MIHTQQRAHLLVVDPFPHAAQLKGHFGHEGGVGAGGRVTFPARRRRCVSQRDRKMGLATSKEGSEARAREIATIKAVAAAENGKTAPGRPVPAPKAVIKNPLAPVDKVAGLTGGHPGPAAHQNHDPTSVTATILPSAGAVGPIVTSPPGVSGPSGSEPAAASDAAAAPPSGESVEQENLRARSHKLTPADFVLLKTIGQGSFGLVLQVRACGVWGSVSHAGCARKWPYCVCFILSACLRARCRPRFAALVRIARARACRRLPAARCGNVTTRRSTR